MPDPSVREIGRVGDLDGTPLVVGVDYDTVTIGGHRLTPDAAEDFAQLFVSACWQAGQQAWRAPEEVTGNG